MTSILPNSRRPDITFCPDGRIDITARIAKMLHLQQGDVIDVAVTPTEYLIYVRLTASQCVGRHEAQVYPTNRGKHQANNFRTYSKTICDAILREVSRASVSDCEKKTIRLAAGSPIIFGPNGTAIPLITRNPL